LVPIPVNLLPGVDVDMATVSPSGASDDGLVRKD